MFVVISMRICSLLLVTFLLAPCVFAQLGTTSRQNRIGLRDQIQIRVEELSDLNGTYSVEEDGAIVLPVVGPVSARGLTESELAAAVRKALEARGLRRATVSVTMTELRSRPVSLLGAVARPGNISVPGQISLLELLTNAGGLTTDHGREILVRRRADNGLTDQVHIPVEALITRGDPSVNIPIFAGDLINVPRATPLTVHFLGEVENTGSLELEGGGQATLLTAIARAGGLTETAAKKIRIKRRNSRGTLEEIVVDYRRILDGDDPDIELQDGDIIVVKESFF